MTLPAVTIVTLEQDGTKEWDGVARISGAVFRVTTEHMFTSLTADDTLEITTDVQRNAILDEFRSSQEGSDPYNVCSRHIINALLVGGSVKATDVWIKVQDSFGWYMLDSSSKAYVDLEETFTNVWRNLAEAIAEAHEEADENLRASEDD